MELEEARSTLAGAMISVATPTRPDHSLDLDTYRRNLEFMLARGVATGNGVLLVAAAGGEFPMLSVAERKELMTAAVKVAGGRVPVVASVQSTSTREAQQLAEHALRAGVAMGQLSSPWYYTPTQPDILHFFADVAEVGLPLMIYNNWWNTANMSLETVTRLGEISGLVALKWSAPTQGEYIEGFERLSDRFAIVDNQMQHVLATLLGTTGFITHVSNFWPEYPLRLWALMQARDLEGLHRELAFKREWRRWIQRVTAYTEGEGPFIKAAMDEVGLASGDPVPPSKRVPEELRIPLREMLQRHGVPRAEAVALG